MENFNTNIQFYSLTYMHQQKTTCLKRHKSAHKCMYKMYKDVYKSMQCKKKQKNAYITANCKCERALTLQRSAAHGADSQWSNGHLTKQNQVNRLLYVGPY